MADSGSLSLMEASQDSEIQILGCGSCYHYNHAHYFVQIGPTSYHTLSS